MEPNKFEKHIKEQLESREITPSASAWESISEQLDASGDPKSKKYGWYWIAAGFIGILMLSIFLFDTKDPNTETDGSIVDTPQKEVAPLLPDTKAVEGIAPVQDKVAAVGTEEGEPVENTLPIKGQLSETKMYIVENEGIEFEDKTAIKENDNEKISIGAEEIMAAKISELVAQVEVLESKNETVTDAELDSMLLMAQKELLTDKLFRQDKSVDAMALLGEVEEELDQSFRDQIFESLKTGFQKVRTAVAQRND